MIKNKKCSFLFYFSSLICLRFAEVNQNYRNHWNHHTRSFSPGLFASLLMIIPQHSFKCLDHIPQSLKCLLHSFNISLQRFIKWTRCVYVFATKLLGRNWYLKDCHSWFHGSNIITVFIIVGVESSFRICAHSSGRFYLKLFQDFIYCRKFV